MIAPSKVFGFLVEQNGVVANPLAGEDINIEPELAWNREIGWRGSFLNNRISGQFTYFNNTSRNFYAAGRNEVFSELGKINIHGMEIAFDAELLKIKNQGLQIFGSVNWMKSNVLAGQLEDRDLFSQVVHSTSTRMEYIDKVNANRFAFDIYVSDGAGGEILLTDENIDQIDFQNITKSVIHFGEDGISHAEAPYTPNWNVSAGFNYDWQQLSVGLSAHFVSDQFTEFHNFTQESADGAIGILPSYYSIDAFVNYDFILFDQVQMTAFVNGKNITNEIYRASRLNRATSGIFGGGFRQIIAGVNIKI